MEQAENARGEQYLVSSSHDKGAQGVKLKTEIYSVPGQEARSPKSRY